MTGWALYFVSMLIKYLESTKKMNKNEVYIVSINFTKLKYSKSATIDR